MKPLSYRLDRAKSQLIGAINQIQSDAQLPAYLLEGIVADVLADVRQQASLERSNDMNQYLQQQEDNK